jgi:large subunit ribosomal protein L4
MPSKVNEVKEPKTVKKTVAKEVPAKKKVAKKAEADVVKAEIKVAAKPEKVATKTKAAVVLTIDVYGLDGKVAGKVTLPEEIFGEKVNKTLLAQAVRVYLANKRQGNASTKTRGEVDGSTRKIYRQKGTGRARHGSVRAPIFVKGGIVFGPKPRDFGLELPKKMRRKALYSALSAKLRDGEVKILSGLESMEPKTKQFVAAMKNLGLAEKKLLLVMADDLASVKRAASNVQGVSSTAVKRLNAYDVLNNRQVVVMKDAIDEMKKHFLGAK